MSDPIGGPQERLFTGAESGGYGDKPSLPIRLRQFDPTTGPAHAGLIIAGDSKPLTQAEADFLNRHHDLVTPKGLPPNEADVGSFVACCDGRRNPEFAQWMAGAAAHKRTMEALMFATGVYSDLGIGLQDISMAFGQPGASNVTLIRWLRFWSERHPRVREVLDKVVLDLRTAGRIPWPDGKFKQL